MGPYQPVPEHESDFAKQFPRRYWQEDWQRRTGLRLPCPDRVIEVRNELDIKSISVYDNATL